MEKPFGQDLWRNLQAVHVDRDGTFRAPVRITGDDGIVVGVDAVEHVDARHPAPTDRRPGLLSRLLRRPPGA
ncbi:hypothetical protein [Nocardioides taihuensis]|uniref:Uncharacterized protein n=1 Tax=Nocardioides taihuensis TaxID=1835606 RepID=A0ABW0BEI2_9ACTN